MGGPPRKKRAPLGVHSSGATQIKTTAQHDCAGSTAAQVQQHIDGWTDHARWLAGEFSRTGDWRAVKAFLVTVIVIRERMIEARRKPVHEMSTDELMQPMRDGLAQLKQLQERENSPA